MNDPKTPTLAHALDLTLFAFARLLDAQRQGYGPEKMDFERDRLNRMAIQLAESLTAQTED